MGTTLRPKKAWEKEFEDKIIEIDDYKEERGIKFEHNCIKDIVDKYLQCEVLTRKGYYTGIIKKVKIKCKDGCIQIERIK